MGIVAARACPRRYPEARRDVSVPTGRSSLTFAAAVFALTLAAPPFARSDRPIPVVTTFSNLGDMVQRIGGEHVAVTTLVGRDGDTHVYRPTPTDARAIYETQILVVNGLQFEGWLDRLIDASDFRGVREVATDGIEPIAYTHNADARARDSEADHDEHAEGGHHEGHDHGDFDPHAWQSLRIAAVYVGNVTAAPARADPVNAEVFCRNREAHVNELEALDSEINRIVAELPAKSRTVVTSHDALRCFGRDYGLTFIAPQGISTESEVSAQDVARLVWQIRDRDIRAVFIENVADPRLLRRTADETGAVIGGTLYPDALSGPVGLAPTYLDMKRHNAMTPARALDS